jgi:hypothetical protein
MSQLSDKKYIETRARSLPIYKCLVTKTWKESKMVGVIVMRKHSNGNITAGFYSMDLLCLGVKRTSYFFNITEEEFLEKQGDVAHRYEEVPYDLAHNIIYAGHDFAMEYDIHPHKDFQVSRFILEEDSEDIPLIDIPVGDKGKPHLLVMSAKDRPDALAKLQKNAGEGNYYYSIGEEQNFDEYFLDNIPPGQLDCEKVLNIELKDLQDEEKVSRRNAIERVLIGAELCTRLLPEELLYVDPKEEKAWKKKWTVEFSDLPARMSEAQFIDYNKAMDELTAEHDEELDVDMYNQSRENKMIELANKYAANPVVIAAFYEKGVAMQMEKLQAITKALGEKLYADYPLLQLSLALGALVQEETDSRFDPIYKAGTIREVIPGQSTFHTAEFVSFGLIKMWQCLDEGDIAFAVKYYHMLANSGGNGSTLLPYVWGRYLSGLIRLAGNEEESEDEEDGDDKES